jgi:hypothetical protein
MYIYLPTQSECITTEVLRFTSIYLHNQSVSLLKFRDLHLSTYTIRVYHYWSLEMHIYLPTQSECITTEVLRFTSIYLHNQSVWLLKFRDLHLSTCAIIVYHYWSLEIYIYLPIQSVFSIGTGHRPIWPLQMRKWLAKISQSQKHLVKHSILVTCCIHVE